MKIDKREKILSAALTTFLHKGYDGTAIPIIAKEAGVSVGTIYRYFKNKETLINELFQETVLTLQNSIKKNTTKECTIKEGFFYVFDKLYEFCKTNYGAFKFISDTSFSYYLTEESNECLDKFFKFVFAELEEFKKQGIVRNIPNMAFVSLIYAPIETTMMLYHNNMLEINDDLIKELREACWNAVRI